MVADSSSPIFPNDTLARPPSVNATTTPPATPSPSGLTTGGKAGIAVGVVTGALAIVIVTICALRRRRKAETTYKHGELPINTRYEVGRGEKQASSELPAVPRAAVELEAIARIPEIDGRRVETSGDVHTRLHS